MKAENSVMLYPSASVPCLTILILSSHSATLLPISGLSTFIPYFETLLSFVTNTLPKPVLVALLYRLGVLQVASGILPAIGADSWENERGVDDAWEDRPVSALSEHEL